MADYRDHYTEDRRYEATQRKLDELTRDGYTSAGRTTYYSSPDFNNLACLGCGVRVYDRGVHSEVCEPRKHFISAHRTLTQMGFLGQNSVKVAQKAARLSGGGPVTPEVLAGALQVLASK